jgi:hypothetical protein
MYVYLLASSSFSYPYPTKVGTTFFSSSDKDSAIIFTTSRLPDVNLPWEILFISLQRLFPQNHEQQVHEVRRQEMGEEQSYLVVNPGLLRRPVGVPEAY